MKTKNLSKLTVIIASVFIVQTGYSCSNFFVRSKIPGDAATVGRSLDFGCSPDFVLARVKADGKTVYSNINVPAYRYIKSSSGINEIKLMPNKKISNIASWSNTYGFIGPTFQKQLMIEGVNTEGLYIGDFYLPGEAGYEKPDLNPDGKPNLSYGDLIPYLLSTCVDVPAAIDAIKKVKVIQTGTGSVGNYTAHPFHWALRDKQGNSAVVEYINGKCCIYTQSAGNHAQPKLPASVSLPPNTQTGFAPEVFNTMDKNILAGQILTNSPSFPTQVAWWQILDKKNFKTANTDKKWNGMYMNGSGMYGVPGDWMAQSRFQRGQALLKVMPKPLNQTDANYLAFQGISSLAQPPGASEGPTIWISISDLLGKDKVNPTYRLKILCDIAGDSTSSSGQKEIVHLFSVSPFSIGWLEFNVKEITNAPELPKKAVNLPSGNAYYWEELPQISSINEIKQISGNDLSGVFDKSLNAWDTAEGPNQVLTRYFGLSNDKMHQQ